MKLAINSVLSIVLCAAAASLAACAGNGASFSGNGLPFVSHRGSGSSPIQHVIIIVQENRSFDNLFATFPKANGQAWGLEKLKNKGKWIDKKVNLKEQPLLPSSNQDIGHCYYSFVTAYDGGKMDGFDLEPLGYCPRKWAGGKNSKLYPYQYVNPSAITPYWTMAQQYVLGDEMFQTQGSGSFTAHQDLIRGGSALGGIYGDGPSLIDTPTGDPWGCDAPAGTKTDLITTGLKWELDAVRRRAPTRPLFRTEARTIRRWAT